jgi:Protein of unknown function (DUF3570)
MRLHLRARWLVAALFGLGAVGRADVLPEDRTDVLYHRYEGGGLTVQGPSVLIRKKFGDSFSASYQYYEDLITSASIDVLSTASAYKETRTQHNANLNYLHGSTLYSVGYIYSNEPDYKSNTGFFSISQSMFGDLTTVSFGYTQGWDKVGQTVHGKLVQVNGTTSLSADADHRNWSVGLSQVLTRNLLLGLNFETDESNGYLQNPYRPVRVIDTSVARGYVFDQAVSPNTRTGTAGSAQLKYYLPWHAAVDGNYRIYSDTWGILANTVKIGYTQPLFTDWTLEASARYYWQNHAKFYSDLFPFANSQNFLSRDRELAQFRSLTLGLGGSWEFHPPWPHWVDKGTLNFNYNRLHIAYKDFHNNLLPSLIPGDEPLYTLDANVMQFFISFWY